VDVAADLGLRRQDLHLFGDIIAKLKTTVSADLPGKLILVSAMTPTKAGEGKTTTSVGLAYTHQEKKDSGCSVERDT